MKPSALTRGDGEVRETRRMRVGHSRDSHGSLGVFFRVYNRISSHSIQ
jgi:hypothetical protein